MEVGESWLSTCVEGIATAGLSSKRSPTGSDAEEPAWFSTATASVMDKNVCSYIFRQCQAVKDLK